MIMSLQNGKVIGSCDTFMKGVVSCASLCLCLLFLHSARRCWQMSDVVLHIITLWLHNQSRWTPAVGEINWYWSLRTLAPVYNCPVL